MSPLNGRGDGGTDKAPAFGLWIFDSTLVCPVVILIISIVTAWMWPVEILGWSNIMIRCIEMIVIAIATFALVKYIHARYPNLENELPNLTFPDPTSDTLEGVMDVAVQTDSKDLQMEIEKMKEQHEHRIMEMNREVRKLKSRFTQKVTKARELADERSVVLSKLQLRIPPLEKERCTLEAEKDAIEKQMDEEKRRNDDLMGRFQRVHQQLMQNGIVTSQGRAYFCTQ